MDQIDKEIDDIRYKPDKIKMPLKEKIYRYLNHVTFKYKKNNSINKEVK